MRPATTTSELYRSAFATSLSSIRGAEKSSGSWKNRYLPLARARPVLRAAPAPPFCRDTTRIRPSFFAYSRNMDGEESVDPSSTAITSISFSVCESMPSKHLRRYFSTL